MMDNYSLLLCLLAALTSTLQFEVEYRLRQIEKTLEEIKAQISASGCEDGKFLKNCKEVLEKGNSESGVYTIRSKRFQNELKVYCDMETRSGGWIYIMKRFDGSQDFYLTWDDYKHGFGDLGGEFWLGLEYLHQLTNSEDYEMLVEVVSWNNTKKAAKYDYVKIGSESEGYSIKILARFEGDAGDSLVHQHRMKFTTKDRDNDQSECCNCARSMSGRSMVVH